MKNIEVLVNQIGKEATYSLLTLAKDETDKQHKQLLVYITNRDYEAAKKIAHGLMATSNLYATSELIDFYTTVKESNDIEIKDDAFVEALKQEIEHSNQRLDELIDKYAP
jgi:hypothetical protein